MVSGFLTSPCDHSRIFSGLASEIRMAEKVSGSFGFSKKEKMSFTCVPPYLLATASRCRRRAARRMDRRRHGRRQELIGRPSHAALDELDVEAQRLQLLDQHVERFRQTRV